jgi:hypothetical protein
VENVGVLVREHHPQPVVVVPDERRRWRWNRRDLDQVVRHGRRPPVGDVRLVHEHDVHVRRRLEAGARREIDAHALGHHGKALGHASPALVVVDGEVGRA